MIRVFFPFALSLFLAAIPSLAVEPSPLAGTWHFDADRSTELSPWRGFVLAIQIEGHRVTIRRQLGAGRRAYGDEMIVDTSKSENVIPVSMWPDNRPLGAYIGGDKTKQVRGTWLDDGRILRLSTDLVLSTQQGDRAVNILSDYKVSASGSRLTLTELRSTRNRPIVYHFNRAPAGP